MKKIITPVGLSIFTNFFKPKNEGGGESDGLQDVFEYLKKDGSADRSEDSDVQGKWESLKPAIIEWAKGNDNACAEFTSIRKITEEFPDEEFEVYLLPSDTVISILAAELIADECLWKKILIKVDNIQVEPFIKGLQVEDDQLFLKQGINSLIKIIYDFLENHEPSDLILNITGGYKASIPYITLMGQIYDIPLYYTFEDTDSRLIKIPKAPLDFDLTIFDDFYDTLKIFKKEDEIEKNDFIIKAKTNRQKIRDTDINLLVENNVIEIKGTKLYFSLIGKLLLQRYEKLRSQGIRNAYSQILGNVVELKVFKYYVENYPKSIVKHSKEFKENGRKLLEIDIFVKTNNEIIAVEVKSTRSFKDVQDKFFNDKFQYLKNIFSNHKIILHIILYSHVELHESIKDGISGLKAEFNEKFYKLHFYWLDLGKSKKNIHWKVDNNNLKPI